MAFDFVRAKLRSQAPSPRFLAFAVAVLAAAVYANSLANGFALDDLFIVLRNERVHGIENVRDAVTSPYWPQVVPRFAMYRPITTSAFAVQWELWGDEPLGFHAVNVLLHVAVAMLLFQLLLRLGASRWAGALGAAVFAVHPVHTEAVANVVGQAEMWAALFYLSGCIAYLDRHRPPTIRALTVGACYLFSLGAKEIGVTLPLALLLLEAVPREPGRDTTPFWRRVSDERRVIPALILAGGLYGAMRTAILGVPVGNDIGAGAGGLSPLHQLFTGLRLWPEYARLMLYPARLILDYSPAVILQPEGFEPLVALGLFLFVALLTLAVAARREIPLLAVGIAWFALVVFPVSNLIIPVGINLAERTLYLPSIGLSLGIAGLLTKYRSVRPAARWTAAAFAVVTLAAGSWRTWTRNPVWYSMETVRIDLMETHPESYRSQWLFGQRLLSSDQIEVGQRFYDRAIALAPRHFTLRVEYGIRLLQLNRPAEAEPHLRAALAMIPDDVIPWILLTQSLIVERRFEEAVELAGEGRRYQPDSGGLHYQRARALAALGRWDEAYAAQRASLDHADDGGSWEKWWLLALIQMERGAADEAVAAAAAARARAPARVRETIDVARFRQDISREL